MTIKIENLKAVPLPKGTLLEEIRELFEKGRTTHEMLNQLATKVAEQAPEETPIDRYSWMCGVLFTLRVFGWEEDDVVSN